MADILLSTSARHEGLSNTVLQALATGVLPVVTASSGMRELVVPGETGFIVDELCPSRIARELSQAAGLDDEARRRLRENGWTKVERAFDFNRCADDYQRTLAECAGARGATSATTMSST